MNRLQSKSTRKFVYIFVALTIAHLAAIFLQENIWIAISKSLLMPTLLAMVYTNFDKTINVKLLLAALVFSWMGDLLLIDDLFGDLFIAGLLSFLISHVFYIFIFIRTLKTVTLNKKSLALTAAVIALYVALILFRLVPQLSGPILIAVVIYALVLASMCFLALLFFPHVNINYLQLIPIGAILFVLSDTLLAFDRFTESSIPLPWNHALVMATYGGAQLCLVLGIGHNALTVEE